MAPGAPLQAPLVITTDVPTCNSITRTALKSLTPNPMGITVMSGAQSPRNRCVWVSMILSSPTVTLATDSPSSCSVISMTGQRRVIKRRRGIRVDRKSTLL